MSQVYLSIGSTTAAVLLVSSDPSPVVEGQFIINTTTDELKIGYGGSWQVLHTLIPPTPSYLLMESGDHILLESGDGILLES